MTQYLGMSMVIIVTGLVIAVLARLVTGGILDEIERIKVKRFERRCAGFLAMLKGSQGILETYIKTAKEMVKMDKEISNEALKKAMNEFIKEHIEKNKTAKTEDWLKK